MTAPASARREGGDPGRGRPASMRRTSSSGGVGRVGRLGVSRSGVFAGCNYGPRSSVVAVAKLVVPKSHANGWTERRHCHTTDDRRFLEVRGVGSSGFVDEITRRRIARASERAAKAAERTAAAHEAAARGARAPCGCRRGNRREPSRRASHARTGAARSSRGRQGPRCRRERARHSPPDRLSVFAARLRPWAVLLFACCAGLVGCGRADDRRAVSSVAESFMSAVQRDAGADACALLTGGAARRGRARRAQAVLRGRAGTRDRSQRRRARRGLRHRGQGRPRRWNERVPRADRARLATVRRRLPPRAR